MLGIYPRTARRAAVTPPPYEPSRTTVDIALGILIGRHGYRQEDAFADLVTASRQWNIGIGSVAAGLIAQTQGDISRGRLQRNPEAAAAAANWANAA
jgi:hypothetical protein